MRQLMSVAVLCCAAMPTFSVAAETEPLKPSTPWNMHYADDSCRLARGFGTGDDQLIVMFDRFGPGQTFKLIVTGRLFRNFDRAQDAEIQFGPNEKVQRIAFFPGNIGKGRPALIFKPTLRFDAEYIAAMDAYSRGKFEAINSEGLATLPVERIAAVSTLAIRKPLRKPVVLALGSMRAAFAASDTCINTLMTKWGVDPTRYASATRAVTPTRNPSQWINSNDYPQSAIFAGATGRC